jgi:hypothetical protein
MVHVLQGLGPEYLRAYMSNELRARIGKTLDVTGSGIYASICGIHIKCAVDNT